MNRAALFCGGALALFPAAVLHARPLNPVEPPAATAATPLDPGRRAERPPVPAFTSVREDTTWFGDFTVVDGEYYARSSPLKEDVVWTFDRGNGPYGDPDRIEGGEGWRAVDRTAPPGTFFTVIDSTLDLGPGVPPPVIAGDKSLWVGVDRATAVSFCYASGAGYGNYWAQRAVSEPMSYNGSGDLTITFKYFNDSEDCYDGTQVYVQREDGSEVRVNPPPASCGPGHDQLGFTGRIGSPTAPAVFVGSVPPEVVGGPREIRLVLEFTSDAGWSDEDGEYETTYGPFGADDVTIDGGGIDRVFDFETGLQGWTPTARPGIWDFAGVEDVGCYDLGDPLDCGMSGQVLEVHQGPCTDPSHPTGQVLRLDSPIIDTGSDDPKRFVVEMNVDEFRQCPWPNAVTYVGWRYFPFVCPATGEPIWSGWVGNTLDYTFCREECGRRRTSSTYYVPEDARMVQVSIYVVTDDQAFTDPKPLLDNIVVGMITPSDPSAAAEDPAASPRTRLYAPVPNPSSGARTAIRFSLAREEIARISVHDLAGREVRRLIAARLTAGDHRIEWDGCDGRGVKLASGLYGIRLEAGGATSAARLLVLP